MYKKDKAYEFILSNNMGTFYPDFDVVKKIIKDNGWVLCSYKGGENYIQDFGLEEYTKKFTAFTFYLKALEGIKGDYIGNAKTEIINGTTYKIRERYFIFYKDELDSEERLRAIFHEIGHIVKEHAAAPNVSVLGKNEHLNEDKKQEAEADEFMLECLAPSAILSKMGVQSEEELKTLTVLDAEYAAKHLINIKMNTEEPPDNLLELYKNTISEYEKRKKNKHKENKVSNKSFSKPSIIALFIISLSFSIVASSFLTSKLMINQINRTSLIETTESTTELPVETTTELITTTELVTINEPATQIPSVPKVTQAATQPPVQSPPATETAKAPVQKEKTSVQQTQSVTSAPVNSSPEPVKTGATVYVTSSGKKYHLSGCRYIKNKTNIKSLSQSEAQYLGYSPCSVCF